MYMFGQGCMTKMVTMSTYGKFYIVGPGPLTKMAAMPICFKNL